MSGRAHIFMLPADEAKLQEFAAELGVLEDRYGVSHVIQVSMDWLLERQKNGQLSDTELTWLKDVPHPPNYGHIHVFLRQVTVNFMFKLLYELDIQNNDYAFSHLLTTSFKWMQTALKDGQLTERQLSDLKNVKPPKIVLHN